MSAPAAPPLTPTALVSWDDPQRQAAFHRWLDGIAPAHRLLPGSLRPASADASFRRYLRICAPTLGTAPTPGTDVPAARRDSFIIMDAPPEKEDCAPFVKVAGLMAQAGLNVPRVLEWDEALGFMLLDDLGTQTMIEVVDAGNASSNQGLYLRAVDALVAWQAASQPGVLPPYDEALLARELALFPDWYLERHRGVKVEGRLRETLDSLFRLIIERNLAAPSVYVHRDFMPRNLMMPKDVATRAGRAGLPGRGVRTHHLRHRQPHARCIPELGRGIRAGHHRAVLAEGAQGRLAGGSRTSASSTAAWSGWACSAT